MTIKKIIIIMPLMFSPFLGIAMELAKGTTPSSAWTSFWQELTGDPI